MSTIEFNDRLVTLMSKLEFFAIQLTSDAEEARDLIQETLYKALRNRDKFQSQGNFKAWLYTIMKNTFINDYRKSQRQLVFMQAASPAPLSGYDSQETPERYMQHLELEALIENLEEQYRKPFLYFHRGYKYEEIAEKMDLPLGTVKSRIFLARKKLSDKLIRN